MHATEALSEANRIMTVCNSCRYCEGLCPVFPAMEMRRVFTDGDLSFLANLCHNCGACDAACQFASPHEFAVDVPQTLARVRLDSYRNYAWPAQLRPVFDRNGLFVSLGIAVAVAAFILAFALTHGTEVLFGVHTDPGAFYVFMPHNAMVALFGAAFLLMIVAMTQGYRNFWRDIRASDLGRDGLPSIWQAMRDAATLRHLDGGADGCADPAAAAPDRRRFYHHATFYGFLLCFAATTAGTFYHYVLGLEAPYAWTDLPVILGVIGGLGLLIGPLGLLHQKFIRDPRLSDPTRFGMETAFIAMLFLTSLTGMLLLLLRSTPAMGVLLAIHLGVVLALFLAMPYSKFVHGLYRFGALVWYAMQTRREHPAE